MNFTGMVLPSVNVRTELEHVPPEASAPPTGSRNPLKLYTHAALRVMVKKQLAVLLDESVAVQYTGVVPTGKLEPDGGMQVTFVTVQLSEVVGAG